MSMRTSNHKHDCSQRDNSGRAHHPKTLEGGRISIGKSTHVSNLTRDLFETGIKVSYLNIVFHDPEDIVEDSKKAFFTSIKLRIILGEAVQSIGHIVKKRAVLPRKA